MSQGQVHYCVDQGVATIVFDRPEARNAMTWSMYTELGAICDRINASTDVRVAILRGAGGLAFVAGTDIEQFRAFESGEDGIKYEESIDALVHQLETLKIPTVAVIQGYAIGGGLAMASVCDFRIATPDASFGAPIARTLGNCLSIANTARVVAGFGAPRTKRMLLLAETIGAAEALACGFLHEIAESKDLDERVQILTRRLAGNAPITMMAAKESIRRVVADGLPKNEDLIRACYGSHDFKIGMEAFLEKKKPVWTGT